MECCSKYKYGHPKFTPAPTTSKFSSAPLKLTVTRQRYISASKKFTQAFTNSVVPVNMMNRNQSKFKQHWFASSNIFFVNIIMLNHNNDYDHKSFYHPNKYAPYYKDAIWKQHHNYNILTVFSWETIRWNHLLSMEQISMTTSKF